MAPELPDGPFSRRGKGGPVSDIDLRFFLEDEEPAPVAARAQVPAEAVPLAAKLERVASTALDKIDEILRVPLPDPSDASFGNVSRSQTAAANTAIGAQLRVDETAMRTRETDVMPRLLHIIECEQRKLAALGEKQLSQVVERVHGEK
jgi:hypothetical protein